MTMYGTNDLRTRSLPERSFLYFVYPQLAGKLIEFHIPFLENIEITESKKPNYITYDLIGRSSNLYAYTGGKSRELNLRFNLTLPSIHDYITLITHSTNYQFYPTVVNEKDRFRGPNARSKYSTDNIKSLFNIKYNNFLKLLEEDRGTGADPLSPQLENLYKSEMDPGSGLAIDILIFWINIIRTCVVNNSKYASLTPPTIYLNHGTMYNNIPCIATSVSVEIITPVGYELYSLTPRQVKITMNLVENRVGDFNEFTPFKGIESESIAGWEAVFDHGTLDPNNYGVEI